MGLIKHIAPLKLRKMPWGNLAMGLFCLILVNSPALAQTETELEIEHYNFENGISNEESNENKKSNGLLEDNNEGHYDETSLNNVPYEKELLRLSEILGAMHYLNTLCPTNRRKNWRGDMGNIITNERAQGKYRGKLTAHFNRGFSTFQENYKTCTANAKQVIEEYSREGAKLSERIVIRYGRQ